VKAAKQAFADADAAALRAELLAKGESSIVIEGAVVPLGPDDVEIFVEAADHFAAAGDSSGVVVLNTDLTPELLDEGLFREILRRVQDMRKDRDVAYIERIRLHLDGSERLKRVAEANRESLMAETLCTELLGPTDEAVDWKEFVLDGEDLRLALVRIKNG
jgi:isoleucyl-tRNA synthetase